MSASGKQDENSHTERIVAKPLLFAALSALSVGAAVIHFAVTFEHFQEYALYGVFLAIVVAAAALVALFLRRLEARA
jgi:hypothetical protein